VNEFLEYLLKNLLESFSPQVQELKEAIPPDLDQRSGKTFL